MKTSPTNYNTEHRKYQMEGSYQLLWNLREEGLLPILGEIGGGAPYSKLAVFNRVIIIPQVNYHS